MRWYDGFGALLGIGLEAKDLSFLQVSLRGIIVFLVALVMVRLADKRFLAKMSAFDAILGFVLASMLARAINGSAPFFPTLGGGFVLVGMHRLIGSLAFRSDHVGRWVKGGTEVLVRHGRMNRNAMRANKISEADLLEEARLNGQVADPDKIEIATLERNGQVSIIPEKNRS